MYVVVKIAGKRIKIYLEECSRMSLVAEYLLQPRETASIERESVSRYRIYCSEYSNFRFECICDEVQTDITTIDSIEFHDESVRSEVKVIQNGIV